MKNLIWSLRYPHRWFQYLIFKMSRKNDAEDSLAAGFAWGVAISFTPLLGFHLLLTIIACKLHRKNIWAGIMGTFIGNPITFPFIWLFVYGFGLFIFDNKYNGELNDLHQLNQIGYYFRASVFNHDFNNFWHMFQIILHDIMPLLKIMMLSSLILFIPIWLITRYIVYIILVTIRQKRKLILARGKNNNIQDKESI
ncbi:MAG: DUF2062 domain-containing protein [Alphaproteobacteria bacterium]